MIIERESGMVSTYSFTVEWRGRPRPCTIHKIKGREISIYFDDFEINTLLGSGILLQKIDGRLIIAQTVGDENIPVTKSLMAAIEETLRQPLLWMI